MGKCIEIPDGCILNPEIADKLFIKKPEKFFRIGSCFKGPSGMTMLCQVGYKQISLIGLFDGNRYKDPITVKDPTKITEEEFSLICHGIPEKFHPYEVTISY